jgi:hypothetical protein
MCDGGLRPVDASSMYEEIQAVEGVEAPRESEASEAREPSVANETLGRTD